ncbi:MAG: hypothetical protein ACJZ8F_01195 [Candidatus Pelagibacter sp.]
MILFKKIYKYLYIFFLVLIIIFSEFSTNFAKAKNFVINDIEIKEEYDLNFDKIKVIDRAFKRAFEILISKILQSKNQSILRSINLNQIKSFVESFSIREEKFVDNNFQAKINVDFNKKELINYFNSKGIITSSINLIDVVILPILIDLKKNQIFTYSNNPFFLNWNFNNEKYHQISYVLPNEDIEDFSIIRNNVNDIENYNFNEIFNKYNVKNRILLVLLKQDNLVKVFSKLKLENSEMYINKDLRNLNLKDLDEINKAILDLKDDYENKWKSLNKINTSIILPIRISIDSNNFSLSNNLENYLNEMDLISNYKIENFNSNQIIYKIIFNSTPDKFLKIMENAKFKIDTSKDIWKLQ